MSRELECAVWRSHTPAVPVESVRVGVQGSGEAVRGGAGGSALTVGLGFPLHTRGGRSPRITSAGRGSLVRSLPCLLRSRVLSQMGGVLVAGRRF